MKPHTPRRPTELAEGPVVPGFVDLNEPERRRQQALLDRRLGELARAQHLLVELDAELATQVQSLQGDFNAVARAASEQRASEAQQRSLELLARLRGGMRAAMLRRDAQRAVCERLREECVVVQGRLEALARQTQEHRLAFQAFHDTRRREPGEADADRGRASPPNAKDRDERGRP